MQILNDRGSGCESVEQDQQHEMQLARSGNGRPGNAQMEESGIIVAASVLPELKI